MNMKYRVNVDKGIDYMSEGELKHYALGEEFTLPETKTLRKLVSRGFLEDEKVSYKTKDVAKTRPNYELEDAPKEEFVDLEDLIEEEK